ncbi:MAG: hypothetical protein LH616_13225 [Ilumatobacteraceae bacterium]|nr:hypothetical protein [Ilumatobacteraceae bacterium]
MDRARYVSDGVNGVLVDTLNIDDLRDAIIRACTLIDVAGRRERSMAIVQDQLSQKRMVGLLNVVYREMWPSTVPV